MSDVNFSQYKTDYTGMIANEYQIDVEKYQVDNPLLDEYGNSEYYGLEGDQSTGILGIVDMSLWSSSTWGSTGISRDAKGEILAAYSTAKGTVNAAIIEANAMLMSSAMEADAAVTSAIIDAEARCQESADNLEAVKIQAETDIEIAKMELEAELEKVAVERDKNDVARQRIEQVESVQAQAALMSAEAKVIEAEGEKAKDEAKAESYVYTTDASMWA